MEDDDRLVRRLVTFGIEQSGRTILIENVPARVDPETGQQFFSPETVERLQSIVWSGGLPDRVQYAAAVGEIVTRRESEITAQLNRVYGDQADGVDAALRIAQQRAIGAEQW